MSFLETCHVHIPPSAVIAALNLKVLASCNAHLEKPSSGQKAIAWKTSIFHPHPPFLMLSTWYSTYACPYRFSCLWGARIIWTGRLFFCRWHLNRKLNQSAACSACFMFHWKLSSNIKTAPQIIFSSNASRGVYTLPWEKCSKLTFLVRLSPSGVYTAFEKRRSNTSAFRPHAEINI